jgi:uncharacterized damage-inducible protein DinB
MLLDAIRSFYQYNVWANHRILKTTSNLSPNQFLDPLRAGELSVRDTLVHTMSAEWIWVSRWQGSSPSAMFEPGHFPNLQAIRTRWDSIEAETRRFIDQLHPPQLVEVISYKNTKGENWAYPLWQQMIHQVNHATQHRSEVASILTHFGWSPGNLDYLVYQDELTSLA